MITLAGLLGFQGLLLYVLGLQGTINLPDDSALVEFAARLRRPGRCPTSWWSWSRWPSSRPGCWASSGAEGGAERSVDGRSWSSRRWRSCCGLLFLTWYLQQGDGNGWSDLWLLFVALVVVMDVALRKTRWGRHVFAVGGNEEAARRSGIKVGRIYTSVFVLCSTLAAVGGLLAAARLTSVSQSSGTGDTNLTAIAAAVIGGTSLFGGRGSAYSAMLGIIVLQAIVTGLNLLGVDSSVRFMVTGAVLLLAVAIDSVSRRARSSSGRG